MRFGLVAAAASLVAHVGIMQLIGTVDPPSHPPPPHTSASISITTMPRPVADPIDVKLIEPVVSTAPAPPPAPDAPPQRVAPRSRASIAAPGAPAITVAPASGGGVEVATAPDAPSKPGMLSMRSQLPRIRSFYLPDSLDIGGAPPPPPLVPSGELHPAGGGTYETQHGGFTAEVARDGQVTFKDRPAFSFHVALPHPKALAKAAAKGLEDWFDDPGKDIRLAARDPNLDPGRPFQQPGAAANEGMPPTPPPMVTIPLIGGSSEITDWVMRKAGMDPYASAKRDYLDATREERTAMRIEQDARQLAKADATMRSNLARVWKRTALPAAERREAIFQLWDECIEDGDEEVVDAGRRARAAVIGFIRGHLPASSPDAFTADELAAFNRARTSKEVFAPY